MWIGCCFSNVFVTIGPPFGRSIHQVLAFWGRCNLAKKISGTRRFGGHKKNAPNEEMKKKATQIVRNQKDRKRETWEDNGNLWIFMMEIDGLMDFFHKRQAFWFWTWGASGNRWWSFVEQIQGKARRLSSVHANVALENPSLFRYVQIIPHLYSPIGSMVLVYIC